MTKQYTNKKPLLMLMMLLMGCAHENKEGMAVCPAPVLVPKDVPPYLHAVVKLKTPPPDFGKWISDDNYLQCLLSGKNSEACD